MSEPRTNHPEPKSLSEKLIWFCLKQKLIVFLLTILMVGAGIMVAPFDWDIMGIARAPVPVDAIPDIGENQQIVFTQWMGRSPQDMQDQVTYPLTVALLGVPGVKTVRSYSMFGFSTIYVIFNESVDFYWSRSRLLEKLSSLPPGTLPEGVRPSLGPDATALGQIFWYTLEGRDSNGNPTGGWDLDELRSVQDFYVRYGLLSAEGVSEVASVGGFVREYQIDVDPNALRAAGVGIDDVFRAVSMSNLDVGASTIEINKVEYLLRGVGFLENVDDLKKAVITVRDNQPIRIEDVAHVSLGPALRRGALDKGGAEAVGGVVVVRYGGNPMATIEHVKKKIAEISPGLPSKTLADGTVSKLTIVPFYDRSGLIAETLGTLNDALELEILVTVIVVLVAVMHLKSSLLISSLLPLSVLFCFIAMRYFGVDANIVALSGIAIAIGTMVDMGIVICENILTHLDDAPEDADRLTVVYKAASEVGSAVLTAVATTIVSFLPVFAMSGAEGKLFKPLAFTKTFALAASIIIALTIIPPAAHMLFTSVTKKKVNVGRLVVSGLFVVAGIVIAITVKWYLGLVLLYLGIRRLFVSRLSVRGEARLSGAESLGLALVVTLVLAFLWLPLGPEKGLVRNMLFVGGIIFGIMGALQLFQRYYTAILRVCLRYKLIFLSLPVTLILFGGIIWLGFSQVFFFLPASLEKTSVVVALAHKFPGLSKEFMPDLDEGSFLYMPTTMPHASIGEVQDVLAMQDMAFAAIPEVETAVGKLGRAETPLDPAPVSMIETVINYKPEYLIDAHGNRNRFRYDESRKDYARNAAGEKLLANDGLPYLVQGRYERDASGQLIEDSSGRPFRNWRPALDPDINPGRTAWKGILTPNDIWEELVLAAEIPGVTSAPKLQPIAARIVMLQSGMRAPMGIKIKGPDLETIEQVGLELEKHMKEVPGVMPEAVIADRIVGKPYLEIVIDRDAIARYGLMVKNVQDVIESAIGGKTITNTVEGRERYPVRVRYARELRDNIEGIKQLLVPVPGKEHIPLDQLALIRYVRGPQVIKSEDTFLVGYVLFDKKPGYAEVDVVDNAKAYLERLHQSGKLTLPPGVSYAFAGSYENQVRAQKKLAVILPLALFVILIILHMQFRRLSTTVLIFSGILVAWSGGFLMIWLYGQAWFLDFSVFGMSMRDIFQVQTINLSVAIWVGFLALFGIASDDGVVMATYLEESFGRNEPDTVPAIREAVVEGARRRIRPALMTSATTILALLPVLTSRGRGADIMVPMAIPSFGGMTIEILTVLIVPVLYCMVKEARLRIRRYTSR
ncbi:efflux RND transporter permease subunit [Desulfovibrio inopinatus]|uniref:efflux RND transporter permease subunit n=1 Tax=Desulfovibrio inopinatus TaxID=102109 RepID=UPI00040A4AB9|nr:efflux RND transporter permease subunit [Desulfovibrio inopinatus]